MESDIRYQTLIRLKNEDKSTGEFIANTFLVALHSDLGTVRRALIELLDEGLIRESNVYNIEDSVIRNINSRGGEECKRSRRFVEDQGEYKKIKPVRIYITMKGLMYLKEYNQFKYESYMDKWKKRLFFPTVGLTLLLSILQISDLINSKEVIRQEIIDFRYEGKIIPIQDNSVNIQTTDTLKVPLN